MSVAPIELHWVQKPGSSVGAFFRPSTLADALQLLAEQPALRPVAGATDLLLELARDGTGDQVGLLDLTRIQNFNSLVFDDATAVLAAGITHADLLASTEAHASLLPLAQACLEIGSPQLRNRATIAGNVVTASPANDTISALLALGASLSIASWSPQADDGIARRTLPLEDFYSGFRETVLAPHELVESIHVPRLSKDRRGIWVKAGLRKAQAISVVHAGFVVETSADGVVTEARIALGSVGPTVTLSEPASQELLGAPLSAATIDRAAQAAADAISPIDDGRATADYRRHSVATVVSRALTALAAGRQAELWPERVPLLAPGAVADVDRRVDLVAASEVSVTVNGQLRTAPPAKLGSLLDWLREAAGTGTKEGCAEGECGACTVHLDGAAVMSCLVPAAQADGSQVTTVEGLAAPDRPHPLQQAFVDKFAVQCGYCIPGFIVAADALVREFDSPPTREQVELALSGNLCRCTGYYNIIDAVMSVF